MLYYYELFLPGNRGRMEDKYIRMLPRIYSHVQKLTSRKAPLSATYPTHPSQTLNKKPIQTTCPNLPVWNLPSQPLRSLPCQDSPPSLSAMRMRIWWMTEKDKCHMIPCIYKILKKKGGYRWTYLQNRNRVTGVESKLTVIRGKKGGRGELGGWDGHIQTRYIK